MENMADEYGLTVACERCGNTVKGEEKYCSKCGYPQNGSQEEIDRYYVKLKNKEIDLEETNKKIRTAQVWLFVVGGLFALVSIIGNGFVNYNLAALISDLILSAIFVGLGFWTKYKAFIATASGLALYITLVIVNGFIDPKTLFYGIIIKFFLISGLIAGLNAARKAEALKKELEVN